MRSSGLTFQYLHCCTLLPFLLSLCSHPKPPMPWRTFQPDTHLYPHVLLANACSGPFQSPYCINSPYSSHCFFTSFHMSGQHPIHPPTPLILVSTHATLFSIHHQPSVLFRALTIYIQLLQLLPSLVPSQHPATHSSSWPLHTTMLCPWLPQFSEHSCLVFANKNNRRICLHLFSHTWHSHWTPKLLRMMLPHCFKLLGKIHPARQCDILEDLKPQCCGNLKPSKLFVRQNPCT